ncbi:(2Fe-2S)-binding protein [Pseudoalteromonas aliena]|jgi:hydrogen cyanide synthase HcnA|uniref:(2Fe-2S)-binding protein n=2 Tax=Pseudoalteromonas aliena TaxID=247523 RepID=A0A1Q2H165_9GAMM|nr:MULTISPECIES: 2Fe-2S iron-sulfur cluster-binding protein [Pseudoalteromonas]AQQ01108.1 (2Fe-2S)-binding protein [Pseudoalteromonas aliena]MBE0358943.1 hydrogen cyanide synthase HcnA [Pseudoalteromonas aliena SW19]TMO03166.1 (2Fe-2S)-binding protein [Pseudoalteromonas sp. S558]
MECLKRTKDITPITTPSFEIIVNQKAVEVSGGETILSVLLATEHTELMANDHRVISGAYCGMGVCHCCHVKVNQRFKKRACQTIVQPNMVVETLTNRFLEEGIK